MARREQPTDGCPVGILPIPHPHLLRRRSLVHLPVAPVAEKSDPVVMRLQGHALSVAALVAVSADHLTAISNEAAHAVGRQSGQRQEIRVPIGQTVRSTITPLAVVHARQSAVLFSSNRRAATFRLVLMDARFLNPLANAFCPGFSCAKNAAR